MAAASCRKERRVAALLQCATHEPRPDARRLPFVRSGRVVRMDSDACLPLGSSSAPVHRPHPNAPLSCMDRNSPLVATAVTQMRERHGLRLRASGRLSLVPVGVYAHPRARANSRRCGSGRVGSRSGRGEGATRDAPRLADLTSAGSSCACFVEAAYRSIRRDLPRRPHPTDACGGGRWSAGGRHAAGALSGPPSSGCWPQGPRWRSAAGCRGRLLRAAVVADDRDGTDFMSCGPSSGPPSSACRPERPNRWPGHHRGFVTA